MARILITGSSDGLGSIAAKLLSDQDHKVVLHARNAERGRVVLEKYLQPGAGDPVVRENILALCEKISSIGFPSE